MRWDIRARVETKTAKPETSFLFVFSFIQAERLSVRDYKVMLTFSALCGFNWFEKDYDESVVIWLCPMTMTVERRKKLLVRITTTLISVQFRFMNVIIPKTFVVFFVAFSTTHLVQYYTITQKQSLNKGYLLDLFARLSFGSQYHQQSAAHFVCLAIHTFVAWFNADMHA